MPKGPTITVDADLIKWARESAGLSIPEAAKKIGVNPDKYEQWEATRGQPTPRQLERLADAVKRPVVAFFLPARPAEPDAPIDFRVSPDAPRPELSTNLRLTIRRTRRVLRIYEELGGQAAAIPFVLSRVEAVADGATRARELLGVSSEEQASWGSPKLALEKWRARIEGLGSLVLQFNMPHETVSGFSLSEGATAIVLNKSDHEARRCFTLFHEWAHVLLGEPGLCDVEEGRVGQVMQTVEAYCNAFAAESLVPLDTLSATDFVAQLGARRISVDRAVAEGVEQFAVSRWVVLIRLLTAQAINRAQYAEVANRWTAQGPPPRPKGGRNVPPKRAIQNLGVPFVSRVLAARDAATITDADASDYLGLKLRWFGALERELPSK